MASSAKRLQNDVSSYEINSDRKVPCLSYYIVKLIIRNPASGKMEEVAKTFIKKTYEDDSTPLAVYLHLSSIYILFSSLENDKVHFLSGSHQKICSYFASTAALITGSEVECSIVELDSRTKVLVYFQTKVYNNSRDKILSLFSNRTQEYEKLSMFELQELLAKKSAIDWNKISPVEKYGKFYKITEEKGKTKLLTMSEQLDLLNTKYTEYLFC